LRKIIPIFILAWFTCAVSACFSEVKPILKPADVDLQTRITSQQKQLNLSITAHEFTREDAKPVQDNLNRIKEQYDRLNTRGALTPQEEKTLHRLLDENSEQIFALKQTVKTQNKGKKR